MFDQDHQLFCGDDVTNPRRMPDDRQAVIDVQITSVLPLSALNRWPGQTSGNSPTTLAKLLW
jgi:hypothetical protein